jgi:acetyltransferase
MRHLIIYAKSEGLKTLYGSVLAENVGMLNMCRELGFHVDRDPDDNSVDLVTLDLSSPAVQKLTQ